MPAPRKIPPKLEPELLAHAGEGWSGARIAAWLATEHGIVVTSSAITKLLKRVSDEREPIVRAVLVEKTAASVGTDLDVLAEVQAAVLGEFRDPGRRGDLRTWLSTVDRLVDVTARKLALAGGAERASPASEDAKARLLEKLSRLTG